MAESGGTVRVPGVAGGVETAGVAGATGTPGMAAAPEVPGTAGAPGPARARGPPRVYATQAVHRMAQMYLYDAVLSRLMLNPDFSTITLDNVDAAFKLAAFDGPFVQLRYQEEFTFKGISFVAEASGHDLGGAIWRISKGTESIVYAVDWNHRSERHTPRAGIHALGRRPTALITDAICAEQRDLPAGVEVIVPARKAEEPVDGKPASDPVDDALVEAVLSPLRQGGSVLMPTDTAGRALELLLRLESRWDPEFHPIVFFNPVAKNIIDFARISLEFMNERLTRSFTDSQEMPFNFNCVRVVSSETELERFLRAPVVVVASWPSLALGFARKLFMNWAGEAKNTILFTDKHSIPPGSIAANLVASNPPPTSVLVEVVERVQLTGTELRKWYEKKEEEAREAKRLAESAKAREAEAAEMRADATDMREAAEAQRAVGPAAAQRSVAARKRADGDGVMYSDEEEEDEERGMQLSLPVGAARQVSTAALALARAKALRQRFAMFTVDEAPHKHAVTPYGQLMDYESMTAKLEATTAPAARLGGLLGAAPTEPGASFTDDISAAASARIDQVNRQDTALLLKRPGSNVQDLMNEVPTKAIRRMETVRVACRVRVLDLGGRIDTTSLSIIVEELQPSRIVLLHAPQEARDELGLQLCQFCEQVVSPSPDELVDLSSGTASFMSRIRDSLLARVAMRKLGDWQVTHMDALLGVASQRRNVSTYEDPGMVWLSSSQADDGHEPYMLRAGAARIPDIKKRLAKAGIDSDIVEGGLLTKGGVMVRRTMTYVDFESGTDEVTIPTGYGIEVEGWGGGEYFRVRQALYDMYTRV